MFYVKVSIGTQSLQIVLTNMDNIVAIDPLECLTQPIQFDCSVNNLDVNVRICSEQENRPEVEKF